MKRFIISFLLMLCFAVNTKAEKVYEFNSTCQQAYSEMLKLKFNAAKSLTAKAKQANADNLIPDFIDNYIDFFTLFLNEDAGEYKRLKPIIESRINSFKEGQTSSPFNLYCLSMLYVQKGTIEIKFGETWNAGWSFRRAYQFIKENKKNFPTFLPNDMLYGGLQTIAGTIPKGYKWLANIFGLKGSLTEGNKLLTNFVNSSDPWARLMSNEGIFMYCYLQFHILNKRNEALQYIQTKKLDVVNNHLFTYMAANLAITNKQIDYAKEVINNRNKSTEYFQTYVWDFELGFIKLYHLETQEAINYFEKYIKEFKGKFYVKDVYQKISWCYYLQGNMVAAENARADILKKGAVSADADKQALREAKSGKWSNTTLLKARLLNDGGYYKEALQLLNTKSIGSFDNEEEQLEYAYRLGRINDDLGKNDDAISWYNKAIALGEKRPEYFAARAALQTGLIYEKLGKKAEAINYYKRCLDMEEEEYKNSIDQKAKSGIARCKGE
ncbi:MAG: hypothetical protein C0459_14205 [Chitinophaga sp.]|jgi:predicted negative regulator of RcsB-dependent stress response|nr:hypothetical protein [Chitinophaga sp.]